LFVTVFAKNSAGFGTLLFSTYHYFVIWFMLHLTLIPALFLACVVRSCLIFFSHLLIYWYFRYPNIYSYCFLTNFVYSFLIFTTTFNIISLSIISDMSVIMSDNIILSVIIFIFITDTITTLSINSSRSILFLSFLLLFLICLHLQVH